MKNRIFLIGLAMLSLAGCTKDRSASVNPTDSHTRAIATKTLYGPLNESKIYKLLNGYSSSDDFEASGVYAQGSYFYMVFDNRYKVGEFLNSLPQNSGSNSLRSSGSGTSNFEGITYDNYGTPNWYVIEESVKNGNNWYPRVREYDGSVNYQSSYWTDYSFTSSTNNKAVEGIAYIRRNSNDYLLSIVEGTGAIVVMQQSGNNWNTIAQFYLPVTFTDYSDIALYGNKLAVTSQEDAQVWIGTLSSTSWATAGSGTVYDFPKGSNTGVVGAGSYTLYGNVEGVSFINDSTIVTCTDKASGSQPSYQSYKDQSVQIFRLR